MVKIYLAVAKLPSECKAHRLVIAVVSLPGTIGLVLKLSPFRAEHILHADADDQGALMQQVFQPTTHSTDRLLDIKVRQLPRCVFATYFREESLLLVQREIVGHICCLSGIGVFRRCQLIIIG